MQAELRRIALPPPDHAEILRYAGVSRDISDFDQELASCLREAEGRLSPAVLYAEFALRFAGDSVFIGDAGLQSRDLAEHLRGASRALVAIMTVGIDFDRLLSRYGRISPARAAWLEAIGAERVEALADAFEGEYRQKNRVLLTPRYSPGYGDLPLSTQSVIFRLLDAERRLGVSLNAGYLITPSKTVTAIVGVFDKK